MPHFLVHSSLHFCHIRFIIPIYYHLFSLSRHCHTHDCYSTTVTPPFTFLRLQQHTPTYTMLPYTPLYLTCPLSQHRHYVPSATLLLSIRHLHPVSSPHHGTSVAPPHNYCGIITLTPFHYAFMDITSHHRHMT